VLQRYQATKSNHPPRAPKPKLAPLFDSNKGKHIPYPLLKITSQTNLEIAMMALWKWAVGCDVDIQANKVGYGALFSIVMSLLE